MTDPGASPEHWGGSAEAWARAGEEPEEGAGAEAAAWMLDAAELGSGDRVLEIACGAGRVGLQAADLVGSNGRVLCTDFAQEMVTSAMRLAERMNKTNVETRVLDAVNMDLGEERFDAVICRFGYMLMPDPGRALRNSREVLDPDGRVVLAVWGRGDENPWLMTIFDAVMGHLGAPPPAPGTPGPFALGDPETLRRLLEESSFADVDVMPLQAKQSYDSVEAWWRQIFEVSGPLAALLGSLSEKDQEAIRDRAFDRAGEFSRAGGRLEFPATVVGARGGV